MIATTILKMMTSIPAEMHLTKINPQGKSQTVVINNRKWIFGREKLTSYNNDDDDAIGIFMSSYHYKWIFVQVFGTDWMAWGNN